MNNFEDIRGEVEGLLNEAIDNIFFTIQEAKGIKNGDVRPEHQLELMSKEEELANLISEILITQER